MLKRDLHLAQGRSRDGKPKKTGKPRLRAEWLIALRWEIKHLVRTLDGAANLQTPREIYVSLLDATRAVGLLLPATGH